MPSGCRIEISYIDPETYTAVVNHDLRKNILRALYARSLDGPVSKKELAESLDIDYNQLVYQLNKQLQDFWKVVEEKKVRGTRMELIAPSNPTAIFITLGREGKVFLVDPLANLFGPLSKVGTRCDGCSKGEAERCLAHVATGCCFPGPPSDAEMSVLRDNGRRTPLRAVDLAMLCALKGIASGKRCAVSIPCDSCPFLCKAIRIEGAI